MTTEADNQAISNLSRGLEQLGPLLHNTLEQIAGKTVAFMLICNSHGVTQVTGNCCMNNSIEILAELLENLRKNPENGPAHSNPDFNSTNG